MKLYNVLAGFSFITLACSIETINSQWYPLDREGNIPTDLETFTLGQEVPIDCIARNIDNGEHKFDEKERIIYGPFPKCKETGKPLTFKYGVSEDINCTIGFTDELYHLFQLYIHEDAPFSCRLPMSSQLDYLEKGGAYVPLTFNFRGEIHDSHVDIDPSMNVIVTKPYGSKSEQNTLISAIAWSSGTNATRIVIGDYLTLNLAIRWYDQLSNYGSEADKYENNGLPYPDGFYKLPLNYIPMSYTLLATYLMLVIFSTGAIVLVFSYRSINARVTKNKYKLFDSESSYAKND